jgi:hypothetical protein
MTQHGQTLLGIVLDRVFLDTFTGKKSQCPMPEGGLVIEIRDQYPVQVIQV